MSEKEGKNPEDKPQKEEKPSKENKKTNWKKN